jgi:hypothetical protein
MICCCLRGEFPGVAQNLRRFSPRDITICGVTVFSEVLKNDFIWGAYISIEERAEPAPRSIR